MNTHAGTNMRLGGGEGGEGGANGVGGGRSSGGHSRDRRSLVSFARGYANGYGFIGVVTVAASLFSLLHPWPFQILVDHVLGSEAAPAWLVAVRSWLPGASSNAGAIAYIAGIGLIVFAIDSILDVLLTLSWIRVGQAMVYDLACTLYSRVLRRSLLFHSRTPVGDTLTRVTGDSWCIYNAASAVLFTPAHALLVGGAAVWLMAVLNPMLALIACAVAPVLACSTLYFGGRIRAAKGQERQAESSLESHVQQTLAGIPVVQAFAQEEREQRRFLENAGGALAAQRRSAMAVGLASGASGLITTLGTVAVLWVGIAEVLAGRLTLGQLTVFLAYLATLHTQCRAVAATYAELKGLGASVQRVKELLLPDDELRPAERKPDLRFGQVGQSIELQDVSFGYEPGRPVLRGLNLHIPAGQTLGIVGTTGAGKSTLAVLLLRLFDPWSGRVLIGGVDAKEVDVDSLRANMAVTLQEPFLFPASIAENIALGVGETRAALLGQPAALQERIESAAKAAMAHEFILALDEGYDTMLGERGITLSGGERQRLALARAIVRDAPILILDEATSALDGHTEAAVMAALRQRAGSRTTVIIAHRLTTVAGADSIAVMQDGRIVEQGRHQDLLAAGGVYAGLWRSHYAAPAEAAEQSGVGV